MYGISSKTVSRRIQQLTTDNESRLIVKRHGRWRIHQLALSQFKPKKKETEYTAITIDPVLDYSLTDMETVFDYILTEVPTPLEIHYSLETKNKDGKPHIHCYLPSDQYRKFLRVLRSLVEISYKVATVFDLDGWREYISKESPIIKFKK